MVQVEGTGAKGELGDVVGCDHGTGGDQEEGG